MDDIEARLAALERAIARLVTPAEAVTLREYVETKLAANQRALDLAHSAMERRLNGMNEFRDTLRDQASRFVTREEVDLRIDRLTEQIREIKSFMDRLTGKADTKALYVSYVIAGLSLMLSAISLISNL